MVWKRLKAHVFYFPTLAWSILLGRVLKVRNWWDAIDENVLLGAVPFENDVQPLAAMGIRGVVNTCEETAGPVGQYRRHGIRQLRIPTIDYTDPSMSDLERAVEFIREHTAAGQKVYVHCKAGRTRSGIVAICWLIEHRQVTAAAAQEILNTARPHVNRHLSSRPVVQHFAAQHLNRPALL
jgi:atypical dual specificity phosphatase